MGIYVDKANNIVEELLKVIPISFFTSEEFQKGCQEYLSPTKYVWKDKKANESKYAKYQCFKW